MALVRSLHVLRSRISRMLAASMAILYALVSMLIGGMLVLGPTGWHTTIVQWETNPYSAAWWNYPALVVVAPGGLLVLPFFATLAMIVVSIGVGIGMTVGLVLAYRVLKGRRKSLQGPATATTVAGLTPAMLALVTLGACCSTAAAATAGVGAVAAASGASPEALLLANWYLGVFQMAVLYVALLAQEQLLAIFAGLLPGSDAPTRAGEVAAVEAPLGTRLAAVGLRIALLIGGVTWALAMLAEWIVTPPAGAGAGLWVWWLLEHEVVAFLAITLALSSPAVLAILQRQLHRRWVWPLRGIVLVGGVLLVGWVPASVAATGLHGLVNEVLGALHDPTSTGAVVVPGFSGLSLVLRWVLQLGLLSCFAIAFALWPDRVLSLLSPPSRAERSAPTTTTVAGAPAPTTAPSSIGAQVAP